LNCRECNHEACPYCYGRTDPGPGFAEWEAELLKIGKDGMHIRCVSIPAVRFEPWLYIAFGGFADDGMFRDRSDHIHWHDPLSTKTANEYQKFRDILKR